MQTSAHTKIPFSWYVYVCRPLNRDDHFLRFKSAQKPPEGYDLYKQQFAAPREKQQL